VLLNFLIARAAYTGGIIMYLALFLFEADFIHIVSITFTALILTELLMVALTVRTWHYIMVLSELLSFGFYIASLFIFKSYFGEHLLPCLSFSYLEFVYECLTIGLKFA